MIFFLKFLLHRKKIACYTLPVMIRKRAQACHAKSERGKILNAEQGQGGESLTTEYVRRRTFSLVIEQASKIVLIRLGKGLRVCQQNLSKNCIFYGHIDRVCSFLFAVKSAHETDSAVRAVPSGLPITAIFMPNYQPTTAHNGARREIMTYINDIPSDLLMKETNMRLRELGCAVTADKKATKRERLAGMIRAKAHSEQQTGATFALGKVHADE